MDELDKAQQKVEFGWDHDSVVDAIQSSLTIIRTATKAVEEHYTEWMRKRDTSFKRRYTQFGNCLAEWRGFIRKAREQQGGEYETVRHYYGQLSHLGSLMEQMNEAMTMSPASLVKMSKELSSTIKDLVYLVEKVDKLASGGSKKSEAMLEDSLEPWQVAQVYEWARENEQRRDD